MKWRKYLSNDNKKINLFKRLSYYTFKIRVTWGFETEGFLNWLVTALVLYSISKASSSRLFSSISKENSTEVVGMDDIEDKTDRLACFRFRAKYSCESGSFGIMANSDISCCCSIKSLRRLAELARSMCEGFIYRCRPTDSNCRNSDFARSPPYFRALGVMGEAINVSSSLNSILKIKWTSCFLPFIHDQ